MSQTNRYLIVGDSGSGKTVLAAELVRALQRARAFRNLVVLSADTADESALSVLCGQHDEVTDELARAQLDLIAYLRRHGPHGAYLEVTAQGDARARFLAALGTAVMGEGDTLVVVDEAQEIADRAAPLEFLNLWTRGRKRQVTVVAITQSIKQRPTMGVSPTVLNRSSVLVALSISDPTGHEHAQLSHLAPRLSEHLPRLRSPIDGGPPEYAVAHLPTGRALVNLRGGELDLSPSSPKGVSA
mgnify:FL=1